MSTKLLSAKEALKIKPDLNDKSNMYDGLIKEFNNIVTTARKENLNEFSFDLNIVYPNDACIFEYELKNAGYSIVGKYHESSTYVYTYTIAINENTDNSIETDNDEVTLGWKDVPAFSGYSGETPAFSGCSGETLNNMNSVRSWWSVGIW